MPELPEVETALQGLKPALEGQTIKQVRVHNFNLRRPVNSDLNVRLSGAKIIGLSRRAKYLILELSQGYLLIHLGMSGHLHITTEHKQRQKHDHIELIFTNGSVLRYNDPRRFGLFLWMHTPPEQHRLLKDSGPEPLSNDFNGTYLWSQCRRRNAPIKQAIMNNRVVVGVGNIYATESLFAAGINPNKAAKKLTQKACRELVDAIKSILTLAINQGGTTLKDFYSSDGKPGYFSQSLAVYGRHGKACYQCNQGLITCTIGQRNTVYCNHCQQ